MVFTSTDEMIDAADSLGIRGLLFDSINGGLHFNHALTDLIVRGLAGNGVGFAQHFLRQEIQRTANRLGAFDIQKLRKLLQMSLKSMHFFGNVAALCKGRDFAQQILFTHGGAHFRKQCLHARAQSLAV